jgi:hypothetical protein
MRAVLAISMLLACLPCHQQIVERWAASPMANSFGLVDVASETGGRFLHRASNTEFRVAPRDGSLELVWRGQRQRLDFFIGSRRVGRSFGFEDAGYLYQAPVGFYAARHAWDMAPGYENDATPDFSRPITPECLFCHANGPGTERGTVNRVASLGAIERIGCDRCHGDGRAHASRPGRDNIVNPARLAPRARDSVCEQCHLAGDVRITQPGRPLSSYRPGEDLSNFVAVFNAGPARRGTRVNSHAEALAASRCRQQSAGKLWCGTCHSPHGRAASYRETCLGCHSCADSKRNNEDCVTCHMPKFESSSGGHTTWTDHSIPRRSLRAQPVASGGLKAYYEGTDTPRNLGLAYAELHQIERAWPLLRSAAGSRPRDPDLYTRIAMILEADGRTAQAIGLYRQSLELNPDQYTAVVRLAKLLAGQGSKSEAAALERRAKILLPRGR